jgi:hypothetical protein
MSTEDSKRLFDDVLSRAIPQVREAGIDIFTFAFYHDHESQAVSICVDTEPNSARLVQRRNAFAIHHFSAAVADGDLKKAALFQANVERSISLGDFTLVNVARTGIGSIRADSDFYLNMIRALRAHESEIVSMASDPRRLLFCSSSEKWEVGYTWSYRGASGRD